MFFFNLVCFVLNYFAKEPFPNTKNITRKTAKIIPNI